MVNDDGDALPQVSDGRQKTRSSMFLAAAMRAGADQAPVKIRNMSPTGAMIEGPVVPATGTQIELTRGPLRVGGTVVWASAKKFGVRFACEASVKDWLAAPIRVEQQRVDEIVALVKAGSAELAGSLRDGAEPMSHKQLIDDLGAIISLIEDLESDLACSDETLSRHGSKLQNMDIAMQMLRAVASELAPQDVGQKSGARLADLRVACSEALARP